MKNKCPICRSNNCRSLHSGLIQGDIDMRFAICMDCEHVFADPMPSLLNLNYFYSSGIYSIIQDIRYDKF